ncbi:hypothetical protein FA15DRAFT_754526 [Coprinopsis marcescibilis]|uniref:Uncharacterized protein n=1 Tax=Coprinopsis marcescibilis TaxID=230819 RepID=A0A5C3L347_COPMA|nr:hypothetical protein FA15DRAFT_754526 [Coprinopsis marcescibilis]
MSKSALKSHVVSGTAGKTASPANSVRWASPISELRTIDIAASNYCNTKTRYCSTSHTQHHLPSTTNTTDADSAASNGSASPKQAIHNQHFNSLFQTGSTKLWYPMLPNLTTQLKEAEKFLDAQIMQGTSLEQSNQLSIPSSNPGLSISNVQHSKSVFSSNAQPPISTTISASTGITQPSPSGRSNYTALPKPNIHSNPSTSSIQPEDSRRHATPCPLMPKPSENFHASKWPQPLQTITSNLVNKSPPPSSVAVASKPKQYAQPVQLPTISVLPGGTNGREEGETDDEGDELGMDVDMDGDVEEGEVPNSDCDDELDELMSGSEEGEVVAVQRNVPIAAQTPPTQSHANATRSKKKPLTPKKAAVLRHAISQKKSVSRRGVHPGKTKTDAMEGIQKKRAMPKVVQVQSPQPSNVDRAQEVGDTHPVATTAAATKPAVSQVPRALDNIPFSTDLMIQWSCHLVTLKRMPPSEREEKARAYKRDLESILDQIEYFEEHPEFTIEGLRVSQLMRHLKAFGTDGGVAVAELKEKVDDIVGRWDRLIASVRLTSQ